MDPIYIEVITSPNCVHSPAAMRVARRIVKGRKEPILLREVSIASREGAEIAKGQEIDSTPAIMINGSLAYVGVPSPGTMQQLLSETVKKETERNSYFF